MEAIKENKGLIAVAVLLALLVGVSAYNSNNGDADETSTETSEQKSNEDQDNKDVAADADETNKNDEESSDNQEQPDGEATTDESQDNSQSYTYTAQPGDSYSVLARKAVQTYGIVNGVNLTEAEILAAEAQLTSNANAEYLNEAQTVEINQAEVKAAIDFAQNMSDTDEAAWATYVPYVNFDTRQNGEPSSK